MTPIQSLIKEREEAFDEKFGKDDPNDESAGSILRIAGCDDCFSNRKERREHKQFNRTTIRKTLEAMRHLQDSWIGDLKKAVETERTRARTTGTPFNAPMIIEKIDKLSFLLTEELDKM